MKWRRDLARLRIILSLARIPRRCQEIKQCCAFAGRSLRGYVGAAGRSSLLTRFIGTGCQQMKMPLNRDERGWNPLTPASELYITKMLSSFVREIILKDVFCSVDICMWVINSTTGVEWGGKTLPSLPTGQAMAFAPARLLIHPWPVTLCVTLSPSSSRSPLKAETWGFSMPLFVNRCDGAGTFRLFVLQGSDCFYILLFSPEMCHHSQTQCHGFKKGTVTAENEDELLLLYIGGWRALHCCRLRRQKGKPWLPELLGIF